jgi:hypothetical protein
MAGLTLSAPDGVKVRRQGGFAQAPQPLWMHSADSQKALRASSIVLLPQCCTDSTRRCLHAPPKPGQCSRCC